MPNKHSKAKHLKVLKAQKKKKEFNSSHCKLKVSTTKSEENEIGQMENKLHRINLI